jgi:hypothetical protein
MANSWNQWVLGYTPERQLQLLRDVGFGAPTWQTLTVLLMSVAAALVGALALLVLRKLRLVPRDQVARAWRTFCRKLAHRGTETMPGEGPRDFARRAAVEQPSLELEIEEIAKLYLGLRYAGRSSEAEARRLRDLVRAL